VDNFECDIGETKDEEVSDGQMPRGDCRAHLLPARPFCLRTQRSRTTAIHAKTLAPPSPHYTSTTNLVLRCSSCSAGAESKDLLAAMFAARDPFFCSTSENLFLINPKKLQVDGMKRMTLRHILAIWEARTSCITRLPPPLQIQSIHLEATNSIIPAWSSFKL
jgi:hypothetical protein